MTHRIVDLFRGPGGWDTGLRMLGRDDVLGVENDPHAHATALAAGHKGILGDVTTVNVLDVCGDDLEGLIASPPCPGFSAAGKGLGRKDFLVMLAAIDDIGSGVDPAVAIKNVEARQHDERSALTLQPLRWAVLAEPEWIALEQVPQVLPLWQAYAPVLEAEGYNVWTGYVHAEQYGVPQTRKRAVLLAHRSRPVGKPTPTHSLYYPRTPGKLDPGVAKWVSMAEALGWAHEFRVVSNYGTGGDPRNRGVRTGDQPVWTVTSKVDRNRWQYVNGNQAKSARRDLDQPAPTVHFGARSNKVEWQPVPAIEGETADDCAWVNDRPSPTVVGPFHPDVIAAPGYRKAGDPLRQRTPGSVRVTVQEAAVLQSFPADYPWQGSKTAQFQQVGNAVPPLMAAHILASLGVGDLPISEGLSA